MSDKSRRYVVAQRAGKLPVVKRAIEDSAASHIALYDEMHAIDPRAISVCLTISYGELFAESETELRLVARKAGAR